MQSQMTLLLGWVRSIGSLAGFSGQSAILVIVITLISRTAGPSRESPRRGKFQRGRVHSTPTRGITTPLSLSGHAAGLPAEIARMPKSWPQRRAHDQENEASVVASPFNTRNAEDIKLTAKEADVGML